MPEISAFFAYPSDPPSLGQIIESAVEELRTTSGVTSVQTWAQTDVAGRFIADQILSAISQRDCLVADISRLNFNVTYEVGFAIGRGKKALATLNSAFDGAANEISKLGIFDTLGYKSYENSHQLAETLRGNKDTVALTIDKTINTKAPIYLVDAKHKTDPVIRIISRVKKARLFFRSFDPNEQPRMSAHEAIANVAQSLGVLVHLLPSHVEDHRIHNLRCAFVAGLAEGMGKALLILQEGNEPVPIDCRDLVRPFTHPGHIDDAIAEFAGEITAAWEAGTDLPVSAATTPLAKLNLGASSAENELRDLSSYYLETDEYQRAFRGDVRLIVGRKGSGKTAIFSQVRDRVRQHKTVLVLDLKPDGYKLLKFKEDVLKLLQEGTLDHTITAFWEYLLLLEICHKILQTDRVSHTRDHRLYDPYRKISEAYRTDDYVSEGDFSERMSKLIQNITAKYKADFPQSDNLRLAQSEVTKLLYVHDVANLRTLVEEYLKFKDALWLLFDNIDKGWPTHGIEKEDLLIIRALVEASRKLERDIRRHDIDCHTLIFLRNDVYELLIQQTPDRGKEAKVVLDWTDGDLLREVLRRRFIFSGYPKEQSFEQMWRTVCVSHVFGEESSQFLIDRSLMRPRCLIDLINHCRSHAVNLDHSRIDYDDILKGLSAYSADLIAEINLEIRDVYADAEDILYEFIGSSDRLTVEQLTEQLMGRLTAPCTKTINVQEIIDILMWYGVLGVVRLNGEITYIYSVNYDMNLLKGIVRKLETTGLVYAINPAFWTGLEIAPQSPLS